MQHCPTEPPCATRVAEVTAAFPCLPHTLQGRRICLRASSLSFSMTGAVRISLPHVWPSPLLCHCVHCLPRRLAAGIGTLVPHDLGLAALSIHFHMRKWGHLNPERAFSGFSNLRASQKSYCLPLFLKCTSFTKITHLVRRSPDLIVSLAIKK